MKVAVPKGRLWPGVQNRLREAGVEVNQTDPRCYRLACDRPGFDMRLFKPRAIPQLVALDVCQFGFVGLDLLKEAGYENAVPIVDLGLNPVEIVVATHASTENVLVRPPRRPLVIATEYVNLADRWAHQRGLAHITVQTWGSTEGYAPEEADIVFDCRETGATIASNGLVVLERIMTSSTWLAGNESAVRAMDMDDDLRALCRALEARND